MAQVLDVIACGKCDRSHGRCKVFICVGIRSTLRNGKSRVLMNEGGGGENAMSSVTPAPS